MIVEKFKTGRENEIFRRAKNKGRMLPDDLEYVDSWVSVDVKHCYQLMRCEDQNLINDWIDKWNDLVDFDIIPVISSQSAAEIVFEKERKDV